MTQNQLTYWRDRESQRSNLANETQQRLNYYETQRHNRELEKLESEKRKIEQQNANTSRFSAKVSDKLANQNYIIQSASNAEQRRSNQYNELLKKMGLLQSQYEATTNRQRQLEEQRKNNMSASIQLSTLSEQSRANQARESENMRSNLMNESIRRKQQDIDRMTFAETRRHNVQSEKNQVLQAQYNLVGSLSNAIGRTITSLNRKGGTK